MKSRATHEAVLFAAALLGAIGSATVTAADSDLSIYYGAFYKPVCDRVVPGFESATADTYPAWERQNHAAIAALEKDPGFQARRRAALAAPPPELASAKAKELANTCSGLIDTFEAAGPGDAKFRTPERTWESFRAALRKANRAALRTCFIGDAKKNLVPQLEAMTDEQLKRMESAIAEMKVTERRGNFQDALIVQRNGQAGLVTFFKAGANWKIEAM